VESAKFSGYHFKFGSSKTVVTNLETGKHYSVSLAGVQYCTCESFKYSPLPNVACKHIKMVAELQGQSLEKAIAPEHVGIDERDLPKGCSLQRTED
jgi:hypothetical protein